MLTPKRARTILAALLFVVVSCGLIFALAPKAQAPTPQESLPPSSEDFQGFLVLVKGALGNDTWPDPEVTMKPNSNCTLEGGQSWYVLWGGNTTVPEAERKEALVTTLGENYRVTEVTPTEMDINTVAGLVAIASWEGNTVTLEAASPCFLP